MLIGYNSDCFYLFDLQSNNIVKVNPQWFNERQIRPSKEYSFLNKYVNLKKIEAQENIFNVIHFSYQRDEDVYSDKLDFRYGKWRPNICTRVMLWSSNEAISNEIKYLQDLLAENAPPNVLKEECNYIAKWINVEKGLIK